MLLTNQTKKVQKLNKKPYSRIMMKSSNRSERSENTPETTSQRWVQGSTQTCLSAILLARRPNRLNSSKETSISRKRVKPKNKRTARQKTTKMRVRRSQGRANLWKQSKRRFKNRKTTKLNLTRWWNRKSRRDIGKVTTLLSNAIIVSSLAILQGIAQTKQKDEIAFYVEVTITILSTAPRKCVSNVTKLVIKPRIAKRRT